MTAGHHTVVMDEIASILSLMVIILVGMRCEGVLSLLERGAIYRFVLFTKRYRVSKRVRAVFGAQYHEDVHPLAAFYTFVRNVLFEQVILDVSLVRPVHHDAKL